MLNRRILRAKVMQTLYALKQAEMSCYHGAHEYIKEIFSPDLNSMEVQDPVKLEGQRKLAALVFDQNFSAEEIRFEDEPAEIRSVVAKAITSYRQGVDKEKKFFKNIMVDQTERLYQIYILCLIFPLDLEAFIASEAESKAISRVFGTAHPILFGNGVLEHIKNNEKIKEWQIRKNLKWDGEILKKTLTDRIAPDEEYKAYIHNKSENFEENKEQLKSFYKKFVFKNDYITNHLEELEHNWTENKSIVKNMVMKTIKAIGENETSISLPELSGNWEEDKQFFVDLYSASVEHDMYLEDIISKKTKHWDIERVAAIDKIILKMALSEMIRFPNIPVKVSINEYIELSKIYSTPKSKQFINGLLDKLSADLLETGVIKKSGRGLIDSK
jgi:N utilization substance protein B